MASEQTIANLIVKLSAQTVELAGGLKKAEGMISGFKSMAMKLLGGISFAAIGAGLVKAVTDARDYAVEMSKLSEKTNTPIEQISALADAAEHTGVGVDTLANMFKFLAKSSSAATASIGPQRSAFETLKVSYESAPGIVRPTIDVMFDVADALKRMTEDEDPQRNAAAMKIMGRGFLDAIPMMVKGSVTLRQMMADAKESGNVIDAFTGKSARKFALQMKELEANFHGLAVAVMSDLLPSMIASVSKFTEWSIAVRSMREPISWLIDVVKSLALVAIPLLGMKLLAVVGTIGAVDTALASIAFARAVGGFSTLGLAVTNLGYVIKTFAVTTLGPLLLNPLTWIGVAVAGLALLWMRLSKGVEEAKVAHEQFAASTSAMDLPTLQANIAQYRAYISTLSAYIEKKRKEVEESTTELGGTYVAAQLDKALKYMAEAEARLKLLLDAVGTKKKEPTPEDDSATIEKITAKTVEYQNALKGLSNPALQARAAVRAFEEELRRTSSIGPQTEAALKKMWSAFNTLQVATEKKAFGEAVNKQALSESVQDVEKAMQKLDGDYQAGLVGLDSYYKQRMELIQRQTRAEVAYLQTTKLPGMAPSQIVPIDTAIQEKKAAGERKITDEVLRQAEVYRRLAVDQREGNVSAIIDTNAAALAELTNRYQDGLVSVQAYYIEKRRLAKEDSDAEIAKAQVELNVAKPEDMAAALNKLNSLRRKAVSDNAAMDREEVLSTRAAVSTEIQLRANYLELLAAGNADGYEAMRQQGAAELALLEQKELDEIAQLNAHLAEKSDAEMGFNEKRQAMEDLYAAQDRRRKQKTVDIERQIDQTRLQGYMTVASGMGDIFGQIYELGGKKMKAFYYLQKAMAIAQITMQAAIAAMTALAPPPVGLGPIGGQGLAAAVWAIAGANIAIVVAQTIKGMALGGPVTQGSGTKDDVPALLMRGEYVIPKRSVEHYGVGAMEAIRRMVLPRGAFANLPNFSVLAPQFAFATGGSVTGGNTVTVPVTVYGGDKTFASKLRVNIEEVVIKTLREHTR